MAVGISGTDAGVIVAEQADPELGRVGRITKINPALIHDLIDADYIPVIATVAIGEDGGCYNVNADVAAGYIASAIGAHKIIFLSDIDGLYLDYPNPESLISRMTMEEAKEIIAADKNSGGMIPKLESCVRALEAGVPRAHIINGTVPNALLLETLTNKGIGTMIVSGESKAAADMAPIGNFAAKLIENSSLETNGAE